MSPLLFLLSLGSMLFSDRGDVVADREGIRHYPDLRLDLLQCLDLQ